MLSDESLDGIERKSNSTPLLVFGEVLFDCFPNGKRALGGAPFNVAWGLKGFGHMPMFVSSVGDDADGKTILSRMSDWGLATEGLQTSQNFQTGTVDVTIEDDEPSYDICEGRAWDFIADGDWSATEMIYHGSLALRSETSRATFEAIVQRSTAPRFFDINLRPPYDSMDLIKKWVRGVDWLKLNIDELESLLGDVRIDFQDSEHAVEALRKQYNISNVLLTGGSKGARIIGEVGEAACIPAPRPDPFVDTVGAGDSFSAYTLHGILSGMPVDQIVPNASRFAAKVCGLQGATTNESNFYQ